MDQDRIQTKIGEITQLLQQMEDPTSEEEVLRRNFSRLRRLAGQVVRNNGAGLSITPSEVVQEFWLRLRTHNHDAFASTDEFLQWAWMKMKNVVWDYARRKKAEKRGGAGQRVDLDDVLSDFRHNGLSTADVAPEALLELEEVLAKLKARNARDSELIDLYYFGGLSQSEIGQRLVMNEDAVKDRLKIVRLWLRKQMMQP